MKKFKGKHLTNLAIIFIFLLLVIVLVICSTTSPILPLRLVDFEHYLAGSRIIWSFSNPYGVVEFFAPPWMAILIGPFLLLPVSTASTFWMLLNFGSIFLTVIMARRWIASKSTVPLGRTLPIALSLMPASLYCYITGQVTPLVGLALILFGWLLLEGKGPPWIFALLALIASLKPHIVLLPMGLLFLELLHTRKWNILFFIFTGFMAVSVFAFITNPKWIPELVSSWIRGDYFGGKPGLAASGYQGLSDFGIPFWIFLPFAVYLIYRWNRDGLHISTMSLAILLGFLIFPYSRRYDYVLFILPGCLCLNELTWRNWLPISLCILSLFILPFTDYSALAMILLTIGVFLKILKDDRELSTA